MNRTIALVTALFAYLLLPVAMVMVAYGVALEYVNTCIKEELL